MTAAGLTAIADVQARVAAIEARFGTARPAVAGAPGASFAAALEGAGGTLDIRGIAAAGTDKGQAAVDAAKKYLGVPYLWGGTDPTKGLDCSGLVQLAFREVGIELPRVSRDQARAGTPVASLAEARPGDLVAFHSPVDHIGIYAGDGMMVVAPKAGDVVKLQRITETPSAIRRVAPTSVASSSAAGQVPAGTALQLRGGGGPASYEDLFRSAGARHGVSPALLSAVARAESGYNPRAVSHAGAQGLMQLMPGTARSLGVDPLDPAQAVDGAARLLSDHLERFGSVELALAAYNAGPGAVARHGGVPPYEETRTYIRRVLSHLGGATA